jgi:hypothetical protein
MKTVLRCLFLFVMMIAIAVPAYSAPQAKAAAPAKPAAPAKAAPQAQPAAPAEAEDTDTSYDNLTVMHVFKCDMTPGVTEAQVDAIAALKLKALRQIPGAEKAKVHVLWPAAVSNMGTTDFQIVWEFPSFADWGKFWDGYSDATSLAKADDATEGKVDCPDSMLWEAHEIVAPK